MLIRPDSRAGWWPFQSAEERKHINSASVKNLTATIEEEESRAPGAPGRAGPLKNNAAAKGEAQILRYFHQKEERFRRREFTAGRWCLKWKINEAGCREKGAAVGGAGRGRKKAGRCQNRERDPHCAGKATCVSYCLMNKICRTNRVGLCAARRRHTAAKIAQSQTGVWGRNLGRTDEREETG